MDNQSVIELEKIRIIPNDVYISFVYTQRVILFFTLITYSILIRVIWTYSPRRIGNYKWYIIFNATLGTLFEFINVSFSPFPLFPYPVIVAHGLSDIWIQVFHDPPDLLTRIVLNGAIFCTIFLAYSTTSMFVFRYWQTTQNQLFIRLASNMKIYVLSYFVVGAVCTCLIVLPLNLQLLSSDELRETIQKIDPTVFEYMRDHVSIGFNVKTNSYFLFAATSAGILLTCCSLTMTFCTFSCYRYLRQNKYMLSNKAAALFRSLINILVIDLFVGFIAGGTMTSLCGISFLMHAQSSSLITLFALTITEFYPLATHVIVLIYVEPYRQGVFRLLRLNRFIKMPKAPTGMEVYSSTVKSVIFLNRHNI